VVGFFGEDGGLIGEGCAHDNPSKNGIGLQKRHWAIEADPLLRSG
jgi:hypothetical protein